MKKCAVVIVFMFLLSAVPAQAKKNGYFGRIVTKADTAEKVIALTFDDGPSPKYTLKIAEVLKKYKIRATFFVCGNMCSYHPEVLKQLSSEGHEIANHSYSHPNLFKRKQLRGKGFVGELNKTNGIIERETMLKPAFFRAPYNYSGKETVATVNDAGLIYVGWTFSLRDWEKPDVNTMLYIFLKNLQPGAIVLLHDGGGDRSRTLAVLPVVIEAAQKQGYKFVPLGELLK